MSKKSVQNAIHRADSMIVGLRLYQYWRQLKESVPDDYFDRVSQRLDWLSDAIIDADAQIEEVQTALTKVHDDVVSMADTVACSFSEVGLLIAKNVEDEVGSQLTLFRVDTAADDRPFSRSPMLSPEEIDHELWHAVSADLIEMYDHIKFEELNARVEREWRLLGPSTSNEQDDPLVTRNDIAAAVHLSKKALSQYSNEWPKPDVPAQGRRADKWLRSRILPTLRRQFPDVDVQL